MRWLLSMIAVAFTSSSLAADKPNILFLFADDMTFTAIHEVGNKEIQTPNLDRLATSGTVFTHAYNTGGFHGAVCVASRTMLVTGRTLWRAKALDDRMKKDKDVGTMWPQWMHAAGYETYQTGKWHIATDPAARFDHVAHVRGGMPETVPEAYNRPLDGKPDPWSPSDPKFGGFWEGGKHWSEVVADDAIGFIDDAKERKKPFFAYVAFNAPHDPRQSPKSFVDRYPLKDIAMPKSFLPEYPWKDAIGVDVKQRDGSIAPYPRTEHAVKVHRQEYYAIITHLDEQIGRILDHLDKTGQTQSTYIFFTADHGLAVGEHGLMGKQNLFDHSVRVPFLARGPRFKAGQRNSTPILMQDVTPTSLELAGAKVPETMEFKSLLPVADGTASDLHGPIYLAYRTLQRAYVKDGYKLILYPEVPKRLLFNLKADPLEMNDLSEDSSQQSRQKELFEELVGRMKQADDPLELQADKFF
ncbi:choline-sulfatase [Planctomyces sp. SCGC AG-212-M04]|nr:choline-sulfatase [Planctomyces sp. SCGC AG-212-M04]